MADELKKKRTVAKARLTKNIRKLKEAIEDNFAEIDVRKCLQDMNTSADELEDLHSSYIETTLSKLRGSTKRLKELGKHARRPARYNFQPDKVKIKSNGLSHV